MRLTLPALLFGKKVGTSSRAEFLMLDNAADLAWDGLRDATRELATHVRETWMRGMARNSAEQTNLVNASSQSVSEIRIRFMKALSYCQLIAQH